MVNPRLYVLRSGSKRRKRRLQVLLKEQISLKAVPKILFTSRNPVCHTVLTSYPTPLNPVDFRIFGTLPTVGGCPTPLTTDSLVQVSNAGGMRRGWWGRPSSTCQGENPTSYCLTAVTSAPSLATWFSALSKHTTLVPNNNYQVQSTAAQLDTDHDFHGSIPCPR